MDTTPVTTTSSRRAIFIDVDGTLLLDGRYIPDSAIEAIHRARANGHLVFLSTGRAMPELLGQILDIGFDGVVSNGGAFATIGDELIVSQVMPQDVVVELESVFAGRGIHWYLQSYDHLFASPGLKLAEWPEKAAGVLPVADLVLRIDTQSDETRIVTCEARSPTGQALLSGVAP